MRRSRGLTLLELMVVATLLTMAVSMVVFKLDGVTESTRLRAAATQIESLMRLMRYQARTAGVPRLVVYEAGGDRVTVHTPTVDGDTMRWDDGADYLLAAGVSIQQVLVEGGREGDDQGELSVRIGPDGRHRAHAVVLVSHDRWAIVSVSATGESQMVLTEKPPLALSYDLLMLELEGLRGAG